MKTFIHISLLFLTCFSTVGQEKKDSIKIKSLKYLIDFSVHNLGNKDRTWQSDLSFGLNFKRHTILIGVTGGPGLILDRHYVNDDYYSGKVDYLSWEQNYTKWGIYGGLLSYQFQFNKMARKSKNCILIYASFSQYNNGFSYPKSEKQVFQGLIGYSYIKKTKSAFSFGFQAFAGVFYNVDIIPYTTSYSSKVFYSSLNKLFPVLVLKSNISYQF